MKLNYFNLKKIKDKILLTNDFGKYAFVSSSDFKKIINKQVDAKSNLYKTLIEQKMVYDDNSLEFTSDNSYELRAIKSHVNTATSLHIFVVTTVCNMSCIYCQANNGNDCSYLVMNEEMAERAVDIALQSPEHTLNFEFQGGEPLVNFEIIRHIVEYAEKHKNYHSISYSVVTNLTLITDEMIDFFARNHFGISTSIDGNELVHNNNRKFEGGEGTYTKVIENLKKVREAGGYVGAIETTTRFSLKYPKEIVQAYADLGFKSIFIRPLTPLGKAGKYWKEIGYTAEEFVGFYKQALDAILEINKSGVYLKEDHASILLKRINGYSMNYMELRSPCGAGVGQMAYYADGNIFTCDEGRMLHEMGKSDFCLGNVYKSTYKDLINNSVCKTVCASSILESIPTCCDCVYQPYCGTCPVVNYALDGDVIAKTPREYRCKVYSGILDYIFEKLSFNNDSETINILKSWSV